MENLKDLLPRILGEERFNRTQMMTEEEKRAYKNQLLEKEGIYYDEKGREFHKRQEFQSPEKRLDLGNFPKSRRLRAGIEKNSNFDTHAALIRQLVKEGRWLYLFGRPQSGKTTLAMHLAWRFLKNRPQARASFLSVPFLLDRLLEEGIKVHELVQEFGGLVVLDDLPTNPKNPWVQETILKLLLALEQLEKVQVVLIGSCERNRIFQGEEGQLSRLRGKLLLLTGEIEVKYNV